MKDESSLARLLDAAKSGDQDAMGELCDRNRSYLIRVAKRVSNNNEVEAASIVQEGMVKAITKQSTLNNWTFGGMQMWLKRIVLNVGLSRRRKDNRLKPLHEEQELALADNVENPLDVDAHREEVAIVVAALDDLPPDQRQAIELRFLDGWEYDAIAAKMGRSKKAVASVICRGIATLRNRMVKDER